MADLPPPIPLPTSSHPAPPPAKTRWWLWIAVAAVVMLLGVGVLVGAGMLLENTGTELSAGDGERGLVLTAGELASSMKEFVPDPGREKFSKKRLIDGSHEISYEYSFDEKSAGPAVFVSSSISLETSTEDAIGSFTGMKLGAAAQFAMMGGDKKLREVVRDDLLKLGDESRASMLEVDGSPVGNAFLVRQGKAVFSALFVGVYFDDPEAVKEMLEPKLRNLAAYQP